MMLHPNVQEKAQAELDRVLGMHVFPSVADRESLPYIEAVVKEALRWHTVAPLGLPHKTDEDDVINGYLIPKGALILPNIWYIHPSNRSR
jgi:cytochrome P450